MKKFTREYAEKLALQKFPKSEYWIGSGSSARLYDENLGDRKRIEEGYLLAIEETNAPELLEALKYARRFVKDADTDYIDNAIKKATL